MIDISKSSSGLNISKSYIKEIDISKSSSDLHVTRPTFQVSCCKTRLQKSQFIAPNRKLLKNAPFFFCFFVRMLGYKNITELFKKVSCFLSPVLRISSYDLPVTFVSQKIPVNSNGQAHSKVSVLLLKQVPPFWQGFGMHGSASNSL